MKREKEVFFTFFAVVLISRKLYSIFHSTNHRQEGPYSKIDQSQLLLNHSYSDDGSFWIIDQEIRIANQVAHWKNESFTIFAVILSAPNHFKERSITRKQLQKVSHRGLKWAFILGQTSHQNQIKIDEEMQQHDDILQLSISDGYDNLAFKTLSAFAWSWLEFKDISNDKHVEWIIKLDDDLDLKMDKIIDSLPTNQNSSYPYIHCPCIMHNIPAQAFNEKFLSDKRDLWPWEGQYPTYCNGYMYALKPELAMKLSAVSRITPLLPLDDIFVSGVLRDRLKNPKSEFKLINRFSFGSSWFEWCLQCPFLGALNYFCVQDVVYQRDYWPWQAVWDGWSIFKDRYMNLFS